MSRRLALARAGSIAAEAILERLHESGFAPDSLVLLDDPARVGTRLPYADGYLPVMDENDFDFGDCALLMLPEAAPELVEAAAGQGCLVVSRRYISMPRSCRRHSTTAPIDCVSPGPNSPACCPC